MSLKLKLKTGFFKLLDQLPPKIGYAIYHRTQKLLSDNKLENKLKSSANSYKLIEKYCEKLEISLSDKRILEIGSGWLPIMPYFFKYLGKAKSIATYDLNLHYNRKEIKRLNRAFSTEFEVGIPENSTNKYALPKAINYYPKTNLIYSKIPRVDLVFSRFVLEHVSMRDIKLMHKKFKKELNPGSYIIHLISPSDHRAYVAKNLSLQDFLQYSKAEWQKKQTKFDYHNRLRLPEYLAIFESAGLEVLHLEYNSAHKNSVNYGKFKALKLHPDFERFTDKELTAGAISVVLKV